MNSPVKMRDIWILEVALLMMGNIHIQPYNPEYIGVLHIFGDFRVDKFPFPLIAYLHVDTLHIEKRNKRKRSFCNTRQSIYSIIQVVSCMRAQRWRSNAAPRFSSIYCPAATLACSHAPSNGVTSPPLTLALGKCRWRPAWACPLARMTEESSFSTTAEHGRC